MLINSNEILISHPLINYCSWHWTEIYDNI